MATSTAGSSAAKSGTGKSGSGRKKKVASQAGVKRYGKPIGTEIGGARDANHAAIQQDQGARKNYTGLVTGDRAAQQKQLDAMNTEDLNKLADIAFSFKSSNPSVVALRIQARNAQARRGIHIKVGQTQTYPKGAPAKAAPVNYNNRGATKALASEVGANSARLIEMSIVEDKTGRPPPPMKKKGTTAGLGNFPIKDLKSLRNAISAIGRAKPEERPKVARHIITMARTLKAGHLVSPAIRHYAAGHSAPVRASRSGSENGTVELAGHWRHGYIPLDAEAVASKMKGGKGKPWWDGPGHSGGSAKKALHGSPKSGSPQRTKVVKSGSADSTTKGATVSKLETPAGKSPTTFGAEYAQKHGADKARAEAAKLRAGNPDKTNLRLAVALEAAAGKPSTGSVETLQYKGGPAVPGTKRSIPMNTPAQQQAALDKQRAGVSAKYKDTPLKFETNYSKMSEKEIHQAYLAAPKGSPEKTAHAVALKQKFDARAKKDVANSQDRLAKLGIDAHGNKVTRKAPAGKAEHQFNVTSKQQIANGKERAGLPDLAAKKRYDAVYDKSHDHAAAMKAAHAAPTAKPSGSEARARALHAKGDSRTSAETAEYLALKAELTKRGVKVPTSSRGAWGTKK